MMMSLHKLYLSGLAIGCLAACSHQASLKQTDKQLVVTGKTEAIARFADLQRKWRPDARVSAPVAAADDKQSSTIRLPDDFTGQQVICLTREALAAGLSYSFTFREARA